MVINFIAKVIEFRCRSRFTCHHQDICGIERSKALHTATVGCSYKVRGVWIITFLTIWQVTVLQIRSIVSIQFIVVCTTPVLIITPVSVTCTASPYLIVRYNLDNDVSITVTSKLESIIQVLNEIVSERVTVTFTHLEFLIEMNLRQTFNLSILPELIISTYQVIKLTDSRNP